MIERTRAANRSSDGPRSVMGPTALISRAMAGSRLATSLAPFASSAAVGRGSIIWGPRAERRGRVPPRAPGGSGEFGHELGELVFGETQLVLAQLHQRTVRNALRGGEVVHCRVEVEETGDEVAGRATLLDDLHRRAAVGRVVVLSQLLEHDVRAIVQLDVPNCARLVGHTALFEERDERHIRDRLFVFLDPAVDLCRAAVIVAVDAAAVDAEHACPAIADPRLVHAPPLL